MRRVAFRHVWISVFVIVWIAAFHYETLRLVYLSPLAGHSLPKLKFLYPPAGWVMFFHVDRSYGYAEVYGITDQRQELLDPHDIFETRAVLYDNIRRNVLISALSGQDSSRFCSYLQRKFPQHDGFLIVYAQHPDVVNRPQHVQRQLAYRCQ